MTFVHPEGLWLLSLAVPIIAFHFYRGRIRRLAVPTLLFWEQVLVEEERRSALRRLRHIASLLMNLAAVVLLASAVAQPRFRPPARYVVILDSSPSMGAVGEDGRTRLERALEGAREFLSTRAAGDRVAVHDLEGMRFPFSEDLDGLRRRLEGPPPTARTPISPRVRSVLAAGEDIVGVLFTDRGPEGMEDLVQAGRLHVARVGSPRENVGWVSGLALRRMGEPKAVILVDLLNASRGSEACTAILSLNGKELERRHLRLEEGERRQTQWDLSVERFPDSRVADGGLVEVRLEPTDAFPLDDTASFVLPPLTPPTVVVFHPGRPDGFLMKGLEAIREEGVVGPVLEATAEKYADARASLGEGGVVVFDRVRPPSPLPPGGVLMLGAEEGRDAAAADVVDWNRDVPPNRFVDYEGLAIRRARVLEGRPLLQGRDGPLATWSAGGGRAVLSLGFALEESDLPLRPAFPMLLRNFVSWAAWEGTRSFRTEYLLGEPVRPAEPLGFDEGPVFFERDDGSERIQVRGGALERAPRFGPGFVRMSARGRAEWMAVNLFDAAESDLRGSDEDDPPGPMTLPPPAPWHTRLPYALVALATVVLILLLEWGLYHRGII